MKFLQTAGLALLGVGIESTMAAAILDFAAQTTNIPQNAQPTGARTALGLQETSRIAQETDPEEVHREEGLLEQWQRQQQQEGRGKDLRWLLNYHQEVRRQQEDSNSMSASASASTTSATGDVASVLSQSGAVYETSTTPTGPITTELGYFTAGGGVWSISSLADGVNAVAGKTLTPGGADAIVGGAEVTAAPSGILVDGVQVEMSTVTISASASSSMAMSMSSGAAGGTASAVASGGSAPSAEGSGSGSASEDGAGARATGGVGAVAALGLVVGALVL